MPFTKVQARADVKIDFTITDDAGAAIDLTGQTVEAEVTNVREHCPDQFDAYTATLTDAANGLAQVKLPAGDTTHYRLGRGGRLRLTRTVAGEKLPLGVFKLDVI